MTQAAEPRRTTGRRQPRAAARAPPALEARARVQDEVSAPEISGYRVDTRDVVAVAPRPSSSLHHKTEGVVEGRVCAQHGHLASRIRDIELASACSSGSVDAAMAFSRRSTSSTGSVCSSAAPSRAWCRLRAAGCSAGCSKQAAEGRALAHGSDLWPI